jgi:hypothetical protein
MKTVIRCRLLAKDMGFKKTSDLIAVSFAVTELAPNTFVQDEIALQLDVLNNEVAVILAIDLDVTPPDAIAATDTRTMSSLTATSQTGTVSLGNSNCLASARSEIRAAGFIDGGVGFERQADSTYTGDLDYLGIIATNNFFVQVAGGNNANLKAVSGRVWLYRAKADSSTYAALVQSEVLSA